MAPLDARSSKPLEGGPSFSLGNRLHRAAWKVAWFFLASWTPPVLQPWRSFLLTLFGAKMGCPSDVRGSARVWYPPHLTMGDNAIIAEGVECYNMAPIVIGDRAIVSQRAFLCGGTHDIRDLHWQLVVRPIVIEKFCWVAAEAFVGPGVTVREGAVVGARGVVVKDCDPWTVYAGNPARAVGHRNELRL